MLKPITPMPGVPRESTDIKVFGDTQTTALVPYGFGQSYSTGQPSKGLRPALTHGSILVESWMTVRRYWRMIALLACLGLVAGGLYTLPQTPRYRTFALLEVRSINGEFMDIKSFDPTSSPLPDPAETDVQTQVKIIESQPVTFRTMERMHTYTRTKTSQTQSYFSGMLSKLGLLRPKPRPSEALLEDVQQSMRVRSLGPTRIIQITADSSDPSVAQLYVNTLADEYRVQSAAGREMNASETGAWLTSQLQELRTHLDQAQANVEKFARQNSLMFVDESPQSSGPSVAQQRLQELQADLARAQADRVGKQAAVEQTTSRSPDSLPTILDNGPIRDYELKLADLRRQLAETSSTLKPTHPSVIRIQNQINEVTTTIQREKGNVLGRMKSEFEAAQRRENLLENAYRGQSGIVAGQQAKLLRYNSLRSEVESSQKLYEAMQRKVTETHIASALHTSPIRIVNPAMLPDQAISPSWSFNLLAGLAMGLVFGVAAAFIYEGADDRIRTPSEAASQLSVRELGAIPNARLALTRVIRPLPLVFDTHNENGKRQPNLVSDSFRSVLQSVLFALDSGASNGVITISSPEPGDGKSSIVGNLAQALAELNRSVLLLDCDLRRPSLHKTFGIENTSGISSLLNGNALLDDDAIRRELISTSLPGISLMPAGPTPDNIPLTLSGHRMQQLLEFARRSFDLVIIDSPPLLQGPDARILGRVSDGLILILRAGKTSFTSAQGARAVLQRDNIRVLGMILNDWNPKESSYYSRYRSYYERA